MSTGVCSATIKKKSDTLDEINSFHILRTIAILSIVKQPKLLRVIMQCDNIWFAYVGFQFRLYQNFRENYNCQRANTYYRNLWAFIENGLVWQQSASTC